MDDDLISEFITETVEGLSMLDQELVRLEQNPGDAAILGNIFRIVHTIKGTCGFLGLPRLESVAHASENVLGKIRDKELEATPDAITLVLASLDNIKELIDFLSRNGQEPEGSDASLIAKLNHYADTGSIGDAPLSSATHAAAHAENVPAQEAVAPLAEEAAPNDFSKFFKGDDDLMAMLADQPKTGPVVALAEPVQEAPKAPPVATAPAAAPAAAPATPQPVQEKGESKDAAAQSIRVNLDVLESLMQMVSELVLTRNQLMQIARTKEDRDFLAPLQQLSHITSELQEGVMKTRMQPIGNAWSKFPRLIRDLSHELNKKIELKMHGAETELDRQLLELIKDPLTHMVRNSCDHGLENNAERRASGKAECGTVSLSAFHEGGHIIIEIADDGKGINVARVREKALSNGLATAAELESMPDQQVMQYIFRAGFSTAEKVTSVSGRGVGMDVVRTNIEKIGGTIELSSELGKGSKFSIKIPLTLAIVSVLIVEVGGMRFALPQINVVELVRTAPETEARIEMINHAPVIRLREKLLPLAELSEMLKLRERQTEWKGRESFIVVCRVGGYEFGLIVDRVFDTEEIVVKPVSGLIKHIPLYSGNTILGDGSIIMILDPNGLARGIGEVEMGSRQQEENTAVAASGGAQTISFLVFNAGNGAPKAVPLELVSRLEEIDMAQIEQTGDGPVIQYRGELMRLITLGDEPVASENGVVQVVVFTYDRKTIGLMVDSIIDIVHERFAIKLPSKEKGFLGSMVISGNTTDIVDVSFLLSGLIDEAAQAAGANRAEAIQHHILLVEDSPFFRNLTVPFITNAGYKVTAAEDAAEAMKLIASEEGGFDMVVTDIEMPGMNGFEFAAACKLLPTMRRTPFIAYTASLSHEVENKGRAAGIEACILKTDRPGLLQAMAHSLAHAIEREMAA